MLKFVDVFGRWEASKLSQLEVAELLGVGERTFRRWCRRYDEGGEAGLLDRRIGKASGKRVPVESMRGSRASVSDASSMASRRDISTSTWSATTEFAWSYSWSKIFLQSRNLLPKVVRRGAHRRKRPRRPLPGMMLHQDAPRWHAWLAEGPPLDLVVTMDDATSEIYLGVPDRGRRRRFDVPGTFGSDSGSTVWRWSALYRSRKSLFSHRRSRWQGGSRPADAGRTCSGASGGRAHRGLLTPGTRPIGAFVPTLYRIGCQKNWCWRAS